MNRPSPTSAVDGVSTIDLRTAMRRWSTGVAVVTTSVGGTDAAMISNSLTSVSMDPPLVSWCVDRCSSSFGTWMAADEFVVHVLGRTQLGLVSRFATRGGDKFEGVAVTRTVAGTPILNEHLVRLRCRTWARHDAGDHVIMLGQVLELEVADGEPLLVADLW